MRRALAAHLLLSAVVFVGCTRHTHRHVREVMLTLEDTERDGSSRSEVVIFQKDKGAERRVRISVHVGEARLVTNDTGPIFADTFERLVNALEENDFYSKKEYKGEAFNGADLTNITVLADEGSHSINVDHHDQQIQNILTAIHKAEGEISWQHVDTEQ
jgi:hypothetical protein